MQKLKLAYFGSPSFSADFLEKIILDKTLPIEIALVITQPDEPAGRKQIMTPSPVKIIAQKYSIGILQDSGIFSTWGIKGVPTGDKNDTIGKKFDLALVYAYGEILPQEILSLPKLGFWNIHPSLLPLYRGASPIAYPLIMGDKQTGVSLMQMDEKMDHGPILAQEKIDILPTETRSDLEYRLTNLGFEIFKKVIIKFMKTKNADFLPGHLCNDTRAASPNLLTLARDKKSVLEFIPQDHALATYTKKLSKSDGFMPFPILKKMFNNEKVLVSELPLFMQNFVNNYKNPSTPYLLSPNPFFYNLFRGLSPWPGLWTLVQPSRLNMGTEKRLKITNMQIIDTIPTITKVQLEGKNEVDFKTFNKVYKIF